MATIQEPDWKCNCTEHQPGIDPHCAYSETGWPVLHPNLMAFVHHEQWVCSDDDLLRIIERLTVTLLYRHQQAG